MMRHWFAAKPLGLCPLIMVCSFAANAPLSAQDCLMFPAQRNEVWFGTQASWNGQRVLPKVQAMGNAEGSFGLEFEAILQERDGTDGISPSFQLKVIPILHWGITQVCPFLGGRSHERKIEWTYEVRTGDVRELSLLGGVVLARYLGTVSGVRIGGRVNTGFVYRDWDLLGRRTVVEEGIQVEQVRWVRRSAHGVADGALIARKGKLAVTLGAGTRPDPGRDLYGFLSLGFGVGG